MSQTGYKWKPIEDLPSNWKEMESETLKNLSMVWKEQKRKIDVNIINCFTKKLHRQWAVETGLLENLYTLKKSTVYSLTEFGTDAVEISHNATNKSPDYVMSLIKDQQSVVEVISEQVKMNCSLTLSYIKEIHAALTKSQGTAEAVDSLGNHIQVRLEKGTWKTRPNNPTRPDGQIHEYCPPILVQDEMDKLLQWHEEHGDVAPEVEAAWLHHRFTQIHPFQDGNGRTARTLATMPFLQKGYFPLVITNESRKEYFDCLEKADQGNLKPLAAFFARCASDTFMRAISLGETKG